MKDLNKRDKFAKSIFIFTVFVGMITLNCKVNAQDVIKHPISEISSSPTYFTYKYYIGAGYKNIVYFIIKSQSGDIKTAFDACDICYSKYKGFSQSGDNMLCNNCGNQYPIEGLGTENQSGGCWPGYLPRTIENDSVVLQVSDIEGGHTYFKYNPSSSGIDNNSLPVSYLLKNYGNKLILNFPSGSERVIHIIGLDGKNYSKIESLSSELSINTGNLSSGIYVLHIYEKDQVYSKTFYVK